MTSIYTGGNVAQQHSPDPRHVYHYIPPITETLGWSSQLLGMLSPIHEASGASEDKCRLLVVRLLQNIQRMHRGNF